MEDYTTDKCSFCGLFVEQCRSKISRGAGSRQRPMSAVKFVASDSGHDSITTDVPPIQETPVSSPRDAAAMNDTGKVKRLRPFTADARTRRDISDQFTTAAAPTMDDFHRVNFHYTAVTTMTTNDHLHQLVFSIFVTDQFSVVTGTPM